MTSRRSFLQMVGLAPVVAPALAKEIAAPQYASGGIVGMRGQFGMLGMSDRVEAIMPLRRAGISLVVRNGGHLSRCHNSPSIRRGRLDLAGLSERVSREKRKT